MRRLFLLLALSIVSPALAGDTRTEIQDAAMRSKLLGERMLTLQWIAFTHPGGRAQITDEDGIMRMKGQQQGKDGDLLTVDGVLRSVGARQFVLVGTIVTKVSHVYGGKECSRTGTFTFRQTGKRRYFRLKEMANPCEGGNLVDYVDVYL